MGAGPGGECLAFFLKVPNNTIKTHLSLLAAGSSSPSSSSFALFAAILASLLALYRLMAGGDIGILNVPCLFPAFDDW